jgi:hypothetical protein
MDPKAANRLVESLGSSLRHGGEALEDIPKVLREVLESGAWRDFTTRMGQRVQHERFEDFVTTQPLAGVGGTMDLVRRIASSDPVTLDLLDRAVQRKVGSNTAVDNINTRPDGTARDAALRRLRKDRPDLHAEVLAGEKSPHAAMVEAGFRIRTITVPAEPHAAVRRLLRHFTAGEIRAALDAMDGAA